MLLKFASKSPASSSQDREERGGAFILNGSLLGEDREIILDEIPEKDHRRGKVALFPPA